MNHFLTFESFVSGQERKWIKYLDHGNDRTARNDPKSFVVDAYNKGFPEVAIVDALQSYGNRNKEDAEGIYYNMVGQYESVNEFGPLAGSGNKDELDGWKRKAMKKSERGNTTYVIGGKYGSYKLSKHFVKGDTYAAYHNGLQQDIEESLNEVRSPASKAAKRAGLSKSEVEEIESEFNNISTDDVAEILARKTNLDLAKVKKVLRVFGAMNIQIS